MSPEVELAWAAGFFDGEGWFSVNTEQRALEMGVGQKRVGVLERFRDAVGVGRIYVERNNTFASWRAVSSADQLAAITALWPYLSEPKKDQARDAMTLLRIVRESLSRRVRRVEAAYDEIEGVIRRS